MDDALTAPSVPQTGRRRLSQLETDAIERLFDCPEFDASAAPSGLLTTLQETADLDHGESTPCVASSHGQQSEPGTRAPTVRWQSVEVASSSRSEQSSELSTFSMHLQRSDLAFRYDLCDKLGAGASAEVFRAMHVASDGEVAIKIFTDSRSDTIHAACTEFVCAMRSAGPSALDYKELAFYKGKPALVMELGVQSLDVFIRDHFHAAEAAAESARRSSAAAESTGSDRSWGSKSTVARSASGKTEVFVEPTDDSAHNIWSMLSRTGPSQFDIMSIMHGTLEGLMVMHAAGLAHLDLKPGNIIMTDFGRSKLADFGAACAIHSRTGRLAVSSMARDEQVDTLCTTLEHTLAGGVKASQLASAAAGLDDSEHAVAAATVAAVQACVLPARSCPGELLTSVDELSATGSLSGGLESRAPAVLRQDRRSAKATQMVTFRSNSCSGEAAATMPLVRGRTQSIMAAYTRQPAYSLREVPMFTCAYSSPERSNACDQRKVDVWAAGCILFELCTGTPFIQARTERERFVVMAQFYDAEWRPPRLPKPMSCWQPLLDAMMAKDPEQRLLPADLLSFDVFAGVRGRSRSGVAAEARGLRMSRSMRLVSTTGNTPSKGCRRLDSRPSGLSDASATRISAFGGEADREAQYAQRRTMAGGEARRLIGALSPGDSLVDRLASGQQSLGSRGRVSV